MSLAKRLQRIWSLELFFVSSFATAWWAMPTKLLQGLSGGEITPGMAAPYGVASVRLIGPLAMGITAVTLMGLRTHGNRVRRSLARVQVAWLGSWLSIFVYNVSGAFGERPPRINTPVILAGSLIFGLFLGNLVGALTPPEDDDRDPPSTTRPAWLRALWAAQSLLFLFVGAVGTLAATHLARGAVTGPLPLPSEIDQGRIQASYWIGFFALSIYGVGPNGGPTWGRLPLVFAVWQSTYALTAFFTLATPDFVPATLALPTITSLLAVANFVGWLQAQNRRHGADRFAP